MRKTLCKSAVILMVFCAAIYIIGALMNQGNTDMTAEMGEASYPLVSVLLEGRKVNCLRGYAEAMESSYLRESITPLEEGRKLNFLIDKYESQVAGISFEVRNLDGSRLIESTKVEEYEESQEQIQGEISIKDLIQQDREYTLVILLEREGGEKIRYYTRVFSPTDHHAAEKLDYIYDFHEKTFDQEKAKELIMYLEPNQEGDNSTFSKVNIHSSFDQVTWGDLGVKRETEPIAYIKELGKQTGSFRLKYFVSTVEGTEKTYYAVEEYYRIRYTQERMYLLDFERTMEQIFLGDPGKITNGKIVLGITDPKMTLTESDGGNVLAFETENCLYSYNIPDHEFVRLFGFYNARNQDERVVYNGHEIKILNVDEAGNVVFMVYGYMNRGRHEGKVGIAVYYYDSTVNTVEEMAYIPYDKSQELLMAEMEQMVYLNRDRKLFVMINQEVFAIHLEERRVESIVSGIQEGSFCISESNQMLVWQDSNHVYGSTGLILMNLQDEKRMEIKAGAGEYILPLGFMEEDLIYGLAKGEDVAKDSLGNFIFPMYAVRIQNEKGEILKEHRQEGVYVTGCGIESNQITLHRVRKTEEGSYEPAEDTQITNKAAAADSSNQIEGVVIEKYEKIMRIAMKQEKEPGVIKPLTPKEVLFEENREIDLGKTNGEVSRYYVYGKNGVEGIYLSEGKAVKKAYDISGAVVNNRGEYIWQRGNLSVRNQIMAIQGRKMEEGDSSLGVCLEAMMEYEGAARNVEYMLQQGESVISILQDSMGKAEILDLSGCSVTSLLYYVNQNIPVLATLRDGSGVLLIGFNEANLVLMDPQTGTVSKKGMNDTIAWMEENGNNFITYIRREE